MVDNGVLPAFEEEACDSLAIKIEKVEGVANSLALELRGHIDTYSALFFQKSGKKVIDAGYVNLIFLLRDVDYVSSMGVGAFLQLQTAARAKGGDIAIVNVHPKVMEIFKLMCLEKLFSCTDSIDEAIVPLVKSEKLALFPKILRCPVCEKRMRAARSGRFRCPECKTVVFVDESGTVLLPSD